MIAYKEFDTENMAIVAISDLESRGFRCIGGHKNANGKWAFYHEAHGHSKILKVKNIPMHLYNALLEETND